MIYVDIFFNIVAENHLICIRRGFKMGRRFFNGENDMIRDSEGVAIDTIVDRIKAALVETQPVMESSKIKIKRIELTLKALASGEVGAQVKLQIPILGELKFGSSISAKSVQTTFLALQPPKPKATLTRTKDMEFQKLQDNLKESILSLTKGVDAAINNKPPLEMDESSVELNFILASKSDISLIIKSDFESELTNNLKVIFEKA